MPTLDGRMDAAADGAIAAEGEDMEAQQQSKT